MRLAVVLLSCLVLGCGPSQQEIAEATAAYESALLRASRATRTRSALWLAEQLSSGFNSTAIERIEQRMIKAEREEERKEDLAEVMAAKERLHALGVDHKPIVQAWKADWDSWTQEWDAAWDEKWELRKESLGDIDPELLRLEESKHILEKAFAESEIAFKEAQVQHEALATAREETDTP